MGWCPLYCLLLWSLSLQYKPTSCEVQAHKGDKVKVHYRVSIFWGLWFIQQKWPLSKAMTSRVCLGEGEGRERKEGGYDVK